MVKFTSSGSLQDLIKKVPVGSIPYFTENNQFLLVVREMRSFIFGQAKCDLRV